MVEDTAEIVHRVPDDRTNFFRYGSNRPDIKTYVRDLWLFIGDKDIRLGITEGANKNIQVSDVLFGPFNFEPDAIEPVHNGSLSE